VKTIAQCLLLSLHSSLLSFRGEGVFIFEDCLDLVSMVVNFFILNVFYCVLLTSYVLGDN